MSSGGGELKSVDEIAKNLVKVIIWTSNDTTETNVAININKPDNLVIPELGFQNQKDNSVALAKSEKEKPVLPPLAKKRCYGKSNPKKSSKKSKKKSVSKSNKLTTPIISCPDDHIGKLVYHLSDQDNESKEQKWVKVIVLETSGRVYHNPKFVLKLWIQKRCTFPIFMNITLMEK